MNPAVTAALRIPLMIPELPGFDALAPYLRRIDANRWYSNFGPLVSELESRLAASFHPRSEVEVVSVANCTQGIELALRALHLAPGAPVLIPGLTFVATAAAIKCAGLTPIVADVDAESWLLTPQVARDAIRRVGAQAVVPVTTFGAAQDAGGWQALHDETGIPIVIDAAAGYGNQVDPGPTCSVFSMHATKPFASGEGGFVVMRSKAFAREVRQLTNFGINLAQPSAGPIGSATELGTNAKLSEYHAAVALASLDRWPETVRRRQELYKGYVARLAKACGNAVTWQRTDPATVRSVCPMLLDSWAARQRAENELAARRIAFRRWYLPTIDHHPAYSRVLHLETPVCDDIATRLLGVPFFLGLSGDAQDEIAEVLASTVPVAIE